MGLYLSEFIVILVAALFAFSFGRTGELVRGLRQAVTEFRGFVRSRKLRPSFDWRWIPFAILATLGPFLCSRLTQTQQLLPEQAIALMLVLTAALVAGYFAFLKKD